PPFPCTTLFRSFLHRPIAEDCNPPRPYRFRAVSVHPCNRKADRHIPHPISSNCRSFRSRSMSNSDSNCRLYLWTTYLRSSPIPFVWRAYAVPVLPSYLAWQAPRQKCILSLFFPFGLINL